MTVFAPSNAAFARANANGWVGNLASLRHLLLRHVVRWECTPYISMTTYQRSSSCLFLSLWSESSGHCQWRKGFQIVIKIKMIIIISIKMIMMISISISIKVTLVSLGSRRAIFTSAGAATLIKTYIASNGVVHIIDSLV